MTNQQPQSAGETCLSKWHQLTTSSGGLIGRVYAIRLVSAGLGYVMQVLLARLIGADSYGTYVYAWSWALMVGSLANIGFVTSPQRFVNAYILENDNAALRGFLNTSRLIPFASSIILTFIFISVLTVFKAQIPAHYINPLLIAALALPALAMADVQDGIARAYEKMELALVPAYIVRPVLIIGLVALSTWAMGYNHTASSVMSITVLAAYLIMLSQALGIKTSITRHIPKGPQKRHTKLWLATSFPIFLSDTLYLLFGYTDILIMGLFVPSKDIGIYFAALKTFALMAYVSYSVGMATASRIATLHLQGRHHELQLFIRKSARWTLGLSLATSAALLIAGPWILGLFGPAYKEGYPLMTIFALGLLARASVGPVDRVLTMTGHQTLVAKIFAVTLGINIALCFLLIPPFGTTGAALALMLTNWFESLILAWFVKKHFGVHPFILAKNPPNLKEATP